MISDTLDYIVNEQINNKFLLGYVKLSIYKKFHEIGLYEFALWLKNDAKEDVEDGLNLFDFLISRRDVITLKPIKDSSVEFSSVQDELIKVYELEKLSLKKLLYLLKIRSSDLNVRDLNFLNELIDKQVKKMDLLKNFFKKNERFIKNNI